jgi:protein SCO1
MGIRTILGRLAPALVPGAPATSAGAKRLCCAVLVLALAAAATAQDSAPPPGFEGATVVEKPNAQVPLDLEFRDETGKTVRLGDYFNQQRPVLLNMIYLRCPMLCNLTLNGQVKALKTMTRLMPGKDFEIVTVSFDPREGVELAAQKRANYLKELGRPETDAGWHFLTSDRPAAARTLGDAIGFGYRFEPKGELYLHQSAIYVCTPDGRVSRTIQGIDFDPEMLRDSLINASEGKVRPGLFGVGLSCGLFHFDEATGRYAWAALTIMRVTGIVTVVLLAVVIGTLIYRDNHRKTEEEGRR